MSAANGVPNATMQYRELTLRAVGFDAEKAAELAPTMEGQLRVHVSAEAIQMARDAGVYMEPESLVDDSPDDPGELAQRYGRRRRY